MTRVFGRHILIVLASCVLSACQMTQHSVDRIRIKHAEKLSNNLNTVQVYCAGTEHCEFGRLDRLNIVDEHSKAVNPAAIKKGWIRLTGQSLSKNGLYLTIPAQQHEMVLRFYPISQQHAEIFPVIHQFKANQSYTFKMYRKRSEHTGSLLNVSAPTPLCVDLMQAEKVIRRFCRPYDAVTGVSEFVEQKI